MRRAWAAASQMQATSQGRRQFLKRSAAMLGAFFVMPRYVVGHNPAPDRWVQVVPCDRVGLGQCSCADGDMDICGDIRYWMQCDPHCGREIGTALKVDGVCYTLTGHVQKDADFDGPPPGEPNSSEQIVSGYIDWDYKDCPDCQDDTCSEGPYLEVTVSWNTGTTNNCINNCGAYEFAGMWWCNGETKSLCPSNYAQRNGTPNTDTVYFNSGRTTRYNTRYYYGEDWDHLDINLAPYYQKYHTLHDATVYYIGNDLDVEGTNFALHLNGGGTEWTGGDRLEKSTHDQGLSEYPTAEPLKDKFTKITGIFLNQVTTTDGVTIKWQKGRASAGGGWK